MLFINHYWKGQNVEIMHLYSDTLIRESLQIFMKVIDYGTFHVEKPTDSHKLIIFIDLTT